MKIKSIWILAVLMFLNVSLVQAEVSKKFIARQKSRRRIFIQNQRKGQRDLVLSMKESSPQEKSRRLEAYQKKVERNYKKFSQELHKENMAELRASLFKNKIASRRVVKKLLNYYDQEYNKSEVFQTALFEEKLSRIERIILKESLSLDQKKESLKALVHFTPKPFPLLDPNAGKSTRKVKPKPRPSEDPSVKAVKEFFDRHSKSQKPIK